MKDRQICRICGVEKSVSKFRKMYEMKDVHKKIWCKTCQKMYVEMLKDKTPEQYLPPSFSVLFP